MEGILRKNLSLIVCFAAAASLAAAVKDPDRSSSGAAFRFEYINEYQTDLTRSRWGNQLQLGAELPLSRSFSFNVSTISFVATDQELLAEDLLGYSNIDAQNIPFALAVAGLRWDFLEGHNLFAGIRRMDEDYFCSDALSLFTNSSYGGFPTITGNYDIAAYPTAAMSLHYSYDRENFGIQASLYNGVGHDRFTGKDNVFRVCPASDGVFALGQVEYRHNDSHYFLGASLHHGKMSGTSGKKLRPTLWAYTEQALSDNLTLIVIYSHAFPRDSPCRNFYNIGGKYSIGKADFGISSGYTRMDGTSEWATELTGVYHLTENLYAQPVVHIIQTDRHTRCIGMLRLGVNLSRTLRNLSWR